MNISNELPVSIYKSEFNGNTFYRLGMFKKDQNGNYIRGYINCQFKKGVEIDTDKKIYLKNAWLTFYIKDKKTIPYIFINEFEYVSDVIKQEVKKDEREGLGKVVDPFEEFANEVELGPDDLPF